MGAGAAVDAGLESDHSQVGYSEGNSCIMLCICSEMIHNAIRPNLGRGIS